MVSAGVPIQTSVPITRCEIIDNFSRLEELRPEWNRIWSSESHSEVFQRFDWLRAWWHSFGRHLQPFCPVIYEDDRVIGILPLGRKGTTLGFLGLPGSDYTDVICEDWRTPEVLNAAFSQLLRTSEWKRCELRWVPEHSRLARHIDSVVPEIRRNLHMLVTGVAGTMILGEDRNQIITQLLRKPYLKRHEHKLAKAGKLTFTHLEDKDTALEHLNGLFQQHIRRRAMMGQPSQFSEPETRDFYRKMIVELDLTSVLRFSILALDGIPVAYHLGFETNGKFVMYKPTFDIDYWEYSPGDVLLYKLLEYARQRGINEYDFTIGSEHYKRHFVNLSRKVYTISLDRPSLMQPLTRALREVRFGSLEAETKPGIMPKLISARPKLAELHSRIGHRMLCFSRFVRLGVSALPKNALWRMQSVSEKQQAISHPPTSSCSSQTNAENWSISRLVDLALRYPKCIDSQTLQKSRERLRAGDQCLGIEAEGKFYVGWLSEYRDTRPETPLHDPNENALVLYDFWEVPTRAQRPFLHPAILTTSMEKAVSCGMPLYVYAWKTGAVACALEGVGFRRSTKNPVIAFLRDQRHHAVSGLLLLFSLNVGSCLG